MQKDRKNIPEILQNNPCIKSYLCWKIHKNPFIRVPVMLLNKQTEKRANERTEVKT